VDFFLRDLLHYPLESNKSLCAGVLCMEVDIDSAQKSDTPFVERFEEFFNQEYKKQIEKLVENYPEEKSLVIDYKRLEKFYPALADEILIKPDEILLDAAKAAKNIHIPTLLTEPFEPFIRISNLPRDRESNIKDVGSKSIGKLVCVEGLVRQITDVLPQLTMAAWKCTRC
jgi:replicative DNA helicase Mcm